MTRYVGVAKAARLLGVSRDNLQQLIRRGDLLTFEGQVDLEALKKRFPALALDNSAMVERTEIIRDSAYAKRVQETLSPNKEDLQSQIRRLKVELSISKVKQISYRTLFTELLEKLSEIQQHSDPGQQVLIDEINAWLVQRINSAESFLAIPDNDSSD
jgi:CDP-4-dehydro-6-deoxyglucose reductase